MQFSVFAGDSMFNSICRNITDMYIKVINNCDVFEHVVKKRRKKNGQNAYGFFLNWNTNNDDVCTHIHISIHVMWNI